MNEEFKDLRLLYEENARMLRFFLTWRQLMFSGYFAVLAALALCFKWALTSTPDYASVFPIIGAIIGISFSLFDYRNRDMYNHVREVGRKIEERMSLGFKAYFSGYVGREGRVRHTWILNIIYLGTAAVMIIIAIIGLWKGYPEING